jgi:hypothetical protein
MSYNRDYIIKQLSNPDVDAVFRALCGLDLSLAIEIIPDLLNLLKSTNSYKIKHQIALILYDTKDPRCVPFLIDEIQSSFNIGHVGTLIYACEAFDCSEYLPLFVDIVSKDHGEAGWSASSVIRNMKGPFNKAQYDECIDILKRKSEHMDPPKNEFIIITLEYLLGYK